MSSKMFRERGYLRLFAHYYRPHLALFLLDLICALGIALVDLCFSPGLPLGHADTAAGESVWDLFCRDGHSHSGPMWSRPG